VSESQHAPLRKSAKTEAASSGTAPAPAIATMGSVPAATLLPSFTIPVADAAGLPRSLPADLITDLPIDFNMNSLRSNAPASVRPGAVAGLADAMGKQAAGGIEAEGEQEISTPAPAGDARTAGRSGTTEESPQEITAGIGASAPGGTASLTAGEQDAPSGRIQAPAGGPLHPFTPSPSPIPAQSENWSIEAVPAPMTGPDAEIRSTVDDAASTESGPSQALPPDAAMPSPAGGERPPALAAPSRTRGPGQVEPVMHSLAQQTAGTALDAATLARNPTGAPGAMNAAGGISGDTAGTAAPAAMRETFAALDAESSTGTPNWVHAGAHRAEAGFQDPALGWVGVRADLSGGGVHAALVPGSAEAAVALGGHLAGLNAYLAEQHTPVESLTLAAPEGRPAESGMGQGAGQNMYQGAGQDTGQGASSGQQSSPQASEPVLTAPVNHPSDEDLSPGIPVGREVPAFAGRAETTAQAVIPGGVHISVMA